MALVLLGVLLCFWMLFCLLLPRLTLPLLGVVLPHSQLGSRLSLRLLDLHCPLQVLRCRLLKVLQVPQEDHPQVTLLPSYNHYHLYYPHTHRISDDLSKLRHGNSEPLIYRIDTLHSVRLRSIPSFCHLEYNPVQNLELKPAIAPLVLQNKRMIQIRRSFHFVVVLTFFASIHVTNSILQGEACLEISSSLQEALGVHFRNIQIGASLMYELSNDFTSGRSIEDAPARVPGCDVYLR